MPENAITKAITSGLKRNLHSALWLFPPILVLVLDYYTGFKGIALDPALRALNIDAWKKVLIWVFRNFIIFFMAYYLMSKKHTRDQMAFVIASLVSFLLIINLGGFNIWVMYHLALALLIWIYLLKAMDSNVEITGSHWTFILILLFDFIGFPLVSELNTGANPAFLLLTNRLSFPLWFFFILGFVEKSLLKSVTIFGATMFYVFYLIPVYSAYHGQIDFDKQQGEEFKQQVQQAYSNVWIGSKIFIRDIMNQASGGYYGDVYEGKVEENKYEQLGVYLEGLKPAEPFFYADEKVTVWGNVKARTLDEPVIVKVECYVKVGDKKIIGTIKGGDLDKGREIFTFEEESFDCTFDEDKLTSGTHTVKIKATFNFETQSYLKTYYMDKGKKRSMTHEGFDNNQILDKFHKTDKNPISVSSNGPIELIIGTKTPPTGLTNDDETFVEIRIDNFWAGDLEKLHELVILVPYGMEIDINDPDSCSNRKFDQYSKNDCMNSCKGDKCTNKCNIIFGGEKEDEPFNGYSLDVSELVRENEDIRENKRLRSHKCKVNIKDAKKVLGSGPFTTKYFRATSKYDYSIEKSVGVVIKKLPTKNEE